MSRQPNVIEIYGNNAAVLCPGCPTIFIVSAVVNKVNGRKCPNCERWTANLGKDLKVVTFSESSSVPVLGDKG
jgi:hypothetical protein